MLQENTFMGVKTTIDLVAIRNDAQKKAEKGLLKPSAYWDILKATFPHMTKEDEAEELNILS